MAVPAARLAKRWALFSSLIILQTPVTSGWHCRTLLAGGVLRAGVRRGLPTHHHPARGLNCFLAPLGIPRSRLRAERYVAEERMGQTKWCWRSGPVAWAHQKDLPLPFLFVLLRTSCRQTALVVSPG